jgi:hypothetical protein
VARVRVGRVGRDGLDEGVGVDDVVAHRREDLVRRARDGDGVARLLAERRDADGVARVGLDDAELVGHPDRLADAGDRDLGARLDVLVDHLGEVHAVHVVGADHDHDVGALVLDDVEALVDRVRTAEVPVLADALLRGHRGDVVAEQRRHAPRLGDVPVEAVRLVLRQHDDVQVVGVHEVRQREVHQPVDAAEGHGGFGPCRRQRHEPLAFPTCEDDCQDARRCHGTDPRPPGFPGRGERREGLACRTVDGAAPAGGEGTRCESTC